MRLFSTVLISLLSANLFADPLPIDPLWKTDAFRKAMTGSYGIDSRIEPQISIDEEEFLDLAAKEMAAGNREAALKVFTETSVLEKSPTLRFALANLQFELDDKEAAVENFKKATKQFPNFRDAHRNLAIALVQLDEIEEAKGHLIRAIELGSREGLTMGLLGYCHSVDENYQAALQAYRLAQLTMPGERQWIIGEAQALQALDQSAEAASLYRSLLKESPGESPLWLNLANANLQNEQPISAIAEMEVVRRLGKLNGPALLSLGNLYLNESLVEEAGSAYLASLEGSEPPTLDKLLNSLEYLSDRQFWGIAGDFAKSIQTVYPDARDKRLPRCLALIEFETGNPGSALAKIQSLVESDPLDGQSIILLAQFHSKRGKREEAEMLLDQAALLTEHQADALIAHGKLLVENGDYEKASQKISRAIQLKPSNTLREYLSAVQNLISE